MKAFAFALLLLAASCRSAIDLDERTLGCESGQDLSIMAGLDGQALREGSLDNRLHYVVEVSNNSHNDVTVTVVRVDQPNVEGARYRLESGYLKADQLIEEGEAHTFRLPTTVRSIGQSPRTVISSSQGIEMVVTVGLSNGDSYRCEFAVPVQ